MSQYYRGQRVRNLYDPEAKEPFRLSRSKLDLFLNCPLCFYLDRRLGVGQPPGFPFALNSAVDKLLKKEFDIHRAKGDPHPLMRKYNIDAIPLKHEDMDKWRESLTGGITYLHKPTNFLMTGGIDDVWVKTNGELIIVDYKSTSKEAEITLDDEWKIGYKRQMEIYQWLFRMNGFKVSDIGYFVYCNGNTDTEAFDGKLEFKITLLPYEGDDGWVEQAIYDAHTCLQSLTPPSPSTECDFCLYRKAADHVMFKQNVDSANQIEKMLIESEN